MNFSFSRGLLVHRDTKLFFLRCLPKAGKTVAKVAKKTLRKLRPLHQQRR